jgi:hypothetical protein
MKKGKRFTIIGVLLVIILLYICNSRDPIKYTKLKLPERNPTEYIFPVSIDTIEKVIKTEINVYKAYRASTVTAQIKYYYGVDTIFKNPSNIHDVIYWHCFIDSSKVYYNSDEPVMFIAHFHIHLISLNDTSTKVIVNTIDTGLYKPTFLGSMGMVHGKYAYHFIPVEPTSVEEYEILLAIGEKLRLKNKMPTLILPEPPKK